MKLRIPHKAGNSLTTVWATAIRFPVEARRKFFSSLPRSDLLWAAPSLQSKGCRGVFSGG